jgi:hypothetical protein
MTQLSSPVRMSIVADRSISAPMTWAQIAIWDVLAWLNPDEASLNLSAVLPAPRGTTVTRALEAISQLVLRHESLHTGYFSIDGELRQCVKDEIKLDVSIIETASDEEVAGQAHSAAAQLVNDTFDISSGVQLRAALVVRDGFARAIALGVSHMAVDAGSFQIVQSELERLLAPDGHRNRLPRRSQQPVERAEFEASPDGAKLQDRALAFWRQTTSLASPASISRLPVPADDQLAWASIESKALTLATRDLAARYSISPSAVILASLGLLIGDFTGEPGPVFRSLIATRFRSHDRNFVGAFNLNSVIHVATDGQRFDDHVRRTAAATLKAFLNCEANPRRVEEVINDVASARGITPGSYCFFNDTATGQAPETEPAAIADPEEIAAAAKGTQIVAMPYQGRQMDSKFFVFLHALQPTCVIRLCKDNRFIPDVSPAEFLGSLENLIVKAATTPGISVQELLDHR